MENKPDYHWSFRSSAEDFDGDRILREAKETGATLIRVERCGDVIWFVRRDFARRAAREGIKLRGEEVLVENEKHGVHSIEITEQGGLRHTHVHTYDRHGCVWWIIWRANGDILDWHARARAAIERANRTTVQGWK